VNLPALGDVPNVNMLTCAAQASVPIIHAMNRAAKLAYAEVVSTISSRSAGPGTRHNIDEFVRTTSRGVSDIGGAQRGKAMLVLNPADPPVTMGNTIYGIPAAPEIDRDAVAAEIEAMVTRVAAYVPGYRLKATPVFDRRDTPWGRRTAISILVQVEGRGDHLPRYSGNLDIMTAAAIQVADQLALRRASAGGARGGLS
jgi:acetaldehyde dehydrogenase